MPSTARPPAISCRTMNRTANQVHPSLSHVTSPGVSEPSLKLLVSRQSSCPFLLHTSLSKQGLFAPPALPGILATTGPSATPAARPHPRGLPVGLRSPPQGLPVLLSYPSYMRAAATTPVEPQGACVALFPRNISLPRISGGSASTSPVSRPARRSLALRPACSLNRPPAALLLEVLQPKSSPPYLQLRRQPPTTRSHGYSTTGQCRR